MQPGTMRRNLITSGENVRQVRAVRFQGLNDYMSRGADFTSNADSYVGIFSVWVKPIFGTTMKIYETGPLARVAILINSSGHFIIKLGNAGGNGNEMDIQDTSLLVENQWNHILCAWDVSTQGAEKHQVYINDTVSPASDTSGTSSNPANQIDYTQSEHRVGAEENAMIDTRT